MSRPVYECPVCKTRQPVAGVDGEDPPTRLSNTQCRGEYGGCHRLVTLRLRPEATWTPGEWHLSCPRCGYETVAWGEMGFGQSDSWTCPDCESRLLVERVTQG